MELLCRDKYLGYRKLQLHSIQYTQHNIFLLCRVVQGSFFFPITQYEEHVNNTYTYPT